MEHKNIVATIYLKNGQAVKGMDNFEPMGWDVISLARLYNDSGIDKIIIFDLSDDDEEHEKNIHTIKNINRNVEIKVCAGGCQEVYLCRMPAGYCKRCKIKQHGYCKRGERPFWKRAHPCFRGKC